MKAIVNGRLVLKDRVIDGALVFDKKITGFCNGAEIPEGAEIIDAKGSFVSPGFIDIHSHGCVGEDVSDGSFEGLKKMSGHLLKNGVTAWLPTTITCPVPEIERAFGCVRRAKTECENENWDGAIVLGANMEGPYLNRKRKGAHLEEHLLPPDAGFLKKHSDIIKIVTIAPELDNGFSAVRAARGAGIVVSIGHSDASYEKAAESVANGVCHATHLFNAMSPLTHREPGVVGAAVSLDISVELIADTFHIHKDLFGLLHKIKGEKLVLITDGVRAAGLPDGNYDLGGQEITLRGIECRLRDGTIAGSVLTMISAVKNMRGHTDAPLHEIINCASRNPARVIGIDNKKGSLNVGMDADVAVFDDKFNILKTIIGGEVKYEA